MKNSKFSRLALPAMAAITLMISPPFVSAQDGAAGPPRGGVRGGIPNATPNQMAALTAMEQALTNQIAAATVARIAFIAATFAEPKNDTKLRMQLDQLRNAELALAHARADQFTKLQSGADKLNAEQVAALVAMGGRAGGGRGGGGGGRGSNLDAGIVFTRPTDSPGLGKTMELPKADTEGFMAMFNGKDLTGWDALPNFWSVKDGAIDCVETGEPGGNIQSDLIWIDSREHPENYANFELRVKFRWISHSGNSGVQFRGVMDRADTNDMVIIADGPHITVKVNDHVFCDMIDENPGALKTGIIAFQQHAGAQMEIQFKDPKIKFLPAKP